LNSYIYVKETVPNKKRNALWFKNGKKFNNLLRTSDSLIMSWNSRSTKNESVLDCLKQLIAKIFITVMLALG